MYPQLDKFSYLGMSNSRLFRVKIDEKEIESTSLAKPSSENLNEDRELQEEEEEKDDDDDDDDQADKNKEKFKHEEKAEVAKNNGDNDDDEEGFKTPTSSDHKIPIVSGCPPAPRKSRPETSKKRKASPRICRSLQLDLSEEVESMFPPKVQEDHDISPKSKKPRKDYED